MVKFIATGFGSGLSPILSGTAGSVAACLLWIALTNICPFFSISNTTIIYLLPLLFTISGFWICNQYLAYSEREDPKEVVIDEWAGMTITLIAASPDSWQQIFTAFALFRFFDIVKPWPVSAAERISGASGVMLDDILAGIISGILLYLLRSFL